MCRLIVQHSKCSINVLSVAYCTEASLLLLLILVMLMMMMMMQPIIHVSH